jgi:hypothetical protein
MRDSLWVIIDFIKNTTYEIDISEKSLVLLTNPYPGYNN